MTRAGRRIHIQDAWTCSERLYLLRDRFVAPSGSSLLWDVVVPSRVIIVLPRGLLALSNTDLDSPPLVGNPQVGLEPSFESAVDPTITLASVLQLVERKQAALGLTLIEIREWEAGPAGAIASQNRGGPSCIQVGQQVSVAGTAVLITPVAWLGADRLCGG